MIKIKLTDGCPNGCKYCHESKEMTYYKLPDIEVCSEIQILDMNFLANPRAEEYISRLGILGCKTELVCGVDYRLLTQDICNLLKENGFIKIRWAWDYSFNSQKKHQEIWKMFLKA